MFNKNRPITSLKEDFEGMGLLKQQGTPEAALTEQEDVQTDDEIENLEEGAELEGQELTEGAELTERLKVQRLKRRPASVRAKARIGARKKKSVRNRKRRMKMRKSSTKRKMKRLKAMKRGRKAGIRKRFQLSSRADAFGNLLESIKAFNFDMPADQIKQEELIKVLESTGGLAAQLGEKFDVIESLMVEMEMNDLIEELIAEEQETLSEATDSTQGDVYDTVAECDDDMMEDDDMDDDEDDSDDDMEEDIHMGDEMESIKEETVQIIDKLNKSVLSPAEAMSALKDMVDYLGGAMKMYMDVAKELAPKMDIKHIGEQPAAVTTGVGDKEAKPHIGEAPPPPVGEDPVKAGEVGKA